MGKVGEAAAGLLANEGSERKHRNTLGKELFKPVYYLVPPVGGGQIKKAVEGIRAVLSGGMYTVGREGEDILRYPVFNESPAELAGNLAVASLFGPISLPTAREWVESGFKDRTAAETATYQALQELGVGGRDAYRVVRALQTTEKEGDQGAAQRKRKLLKEESALTNEQKLAAYYGMLASEEERALVDRLPLEGKQAGEVYRALSALHAVEDDKDIEEKKAEKILRLSHTGLTEEAKAEIYLDRVAGKTEQEKAQALESECGLTGAEYWRVASKVLTREGLKDLVTGETVSGSKSRAQMKALLELKLDEKKEQAVYFALLAGDSGNERADALREAGVSRTVYYRYLTKSRDVKADTRADGSALPGSLAGKKLELIDQMNLTEAQKTALFLAEGATEGQADEYEDHAAALEAKGIGRYDFLCFLVRTGAMQSDRDKNGKSISGSKQQKVWAYIDQMDLTSAQKDALHLMEYSEKSLYKAPWHR